MQNVFILKLNTFWNNYSLLFLWMFFYVVAIRSFEFIFLLENKLSMTNPWRSFTYALEFDLILIGIMYLILIIPSIGLYLWHQRLLRVWFAILFFTYGLIHIFLIQFFYTSNLLLDKTVFYFSWAEIEIIIGGESGQLFGPYFWLYIGTLLWWIIGSFIYLKWVRSNKTWAICSKIITLVLVAMWILRGQVHPSQLNAYSHFETQLHTSKPAYFISSIAETWYQAKSNEDPIRAAKAYRTTLGQKKDFQHLSYPFYQSKSWYCNNDWSTYFNDLDSNTNVVMIFAEGLSTQFSGTHTLNGSYTPFLDSLAGESLYWPNMLSNTDRTHGVFASALAGLPHGFERGFLNYKGTQPDYFSLPKILEQSNYQLNFIYGGWSFFDNYNGFLRDNNFDSIVDRDYIKKYFLKEDTSSLEFSWGFHDEKSVATYFQFLEEHGSSSPYFNLYLTLSLHSPFNIPSKDSLSQSIDKQLNKNQTPFFQTHKNVLTAAYYSDQSLKRFFASYKKRPDFKNTIFLIMGDHSVAELDRNRVLARYRVPFYIYSPLLKKTETFNEIISHWDVPATVIDILPVAKMNKNYNHWLGKGVQLSQKCTAQAPIFVGTFRGDINGVIWKKYAYIHNQLYAIQDNFELTPATNSAMENKLSEALKLYRWANAFSINENRIVPL